MYEELKARLLAWTKTSSSFGLDSIGKDIAAALEAIEQLERKLAERDAELWRANQKRKQLSVVKDCDDRYFTYDLSSEKIGPQVCIAETVTIDSAMSQGEQK